MSPSKSRLQRREHGKLVMLQPKLRGVIGVCENCDTPNVEVFKMHGNILLCQACRDLETAAYEKAASANKAVQEFRRSDASITVKGDIHLVKGIPIVELKASIQNDPGIKAEDKDEVLVKECQKHVQRLDEVIFSRREELNQLELERKA